MIRLKNISIGYRNRRILEHVSLEVPSGKLIALLGCNGSGKSTLLKAIASGETLLEGEVLIDGKSLRGRDAGELARLIATVGTEKARIPNLRCREMVALGRAPYTDWIGRLGPEDRDAVDQALAAVDMSDFAERSLDSMSDGEGQKVMIARALAQHTPVLLLDEPTAWLDIPGRYSTGALLHRLAQTEGKTILYSTHDLEVARKYADLLLLLHTDEEGVGRLALNTPAALEASGLLQQVFHLDKLPE